jgi:hypothetical protein
LNIGNNYGVGASLSHTEFGGNTIGASFDIDNSGKNYGFGVSYNSIHGSGANISFGQSGGTGPIKSVSGSLNWQDGQGISTSSSYAMYSNAEMMAPSKRETLEAARLANNLGPEVSDAVIIAKEKERLKSINAGNNLSYTNSVSRFLFGDVGGSLSSLFGAGHDADGFIDAEGKYVVNTCFVAGTKIHTAKGLKAIEEIKIDDYVLSWNERTGKNDYMKVLNTFVRTTNAIYKLELDDKTIIETTWDHPFWVAGKGWVKTKDLKTTDMLSLNDSKQVSIKSIEIDERNESVYNFEVEENHTYYVSELGVRVHNNDCGDYLPHPEAILNYVTQDLQDRKRYIDESIQSAIDKSMQGELLEQANKLYPGVDKMTEEQKQEVIKTSPKAAMAIILYEFATGTGRKKRRFGADAAITKVLQELDATKNVIEEFYEKNQGKTVEELNNNIDEKKPYRGHYEFSPNSKFQKFFNLFPSLKEHTKALYERWVNDDTVRLFMGGMSYRIVPNGNKLKVTIIDGKNRNSIYAHASEYFDIAKNNGRKGETGYIFSNTLQEYSFEIDIDESRLKEKEKKWYE